MAGQSVSLNLREKKVNNRKRNAEAAPGQPLCPSSLSINAPATPLQNSDHPRDSSLQTRGIPQLKRKCDLLDQILWGCFTLTKIKKQTKKTKNTRQRRLHLLVAGVWWVPRAFPRVWWRVRVNGNSLPSRRANLRTKPRVIWSEPESLIVLLRRLSAWYVLAI